MRKIILIFNSSHWEKEPLMCISAALSLREEKQFPDTERWGDQCDTLGNTQIRRTLWERTAFSRTNCPYPSDIPANGSPNGSSPREKFLGTSENTRMKLRWVEEVGPQPESRAIANAKWLRDNFCLSSCLQRQWFRLRLRLSIDYLYLLNSMIYDLKRIVDLRRLFDPVLHSSIDGTKNIARIANAVQVSIFVY